MEPIKIAVAQFENASGDKRYNLHIIEEMTARAAAQGAQMISFHECSITGYSFARKCSREQLTEIAEPVPDGKSIAELVRIAGKYNIAVLAGLFEKDADQLFNTYVCVDGDGLQAKYRKLHPFISSQLSPGNSYCVFGIGGWKCGILICYDNNIIENVRATSLLGADIIFMPHVTMCTPSTRPGAGFVDPALWRNRENDPASLRLEFTGMKGRAWLMKWLPARAYDNGLYVVFSNPVGMDDDQVKNGHSMILDPFGDILAECESFENEIVVATLTPDKLQKAGAYRYKKARRPELYGDIISRPHQSELKVSWME